MPELNPHTGLDDMIPFTYIPVGLAKGFQMLQFDSTGKAFVGRG